MMVRVDKAILDSFLEEQQDLTAVERFARRHEDHTLPQGESRYRELIPRTTPGPGQQYAFEVNLDQCTGCKACVTGCHNENGLDENETWRSVGLVHGGTSEAPALQHITTACHHCLEPACASGCPTKAYEKDPETGIVRHLDDQCFGCQYCILKCPYDVPKYNKKRGIVRKCDMCIGRLKAGEAPACVRACPNEAIRITLVETSAVRTRPSDYVAVPDAPDSRYTLPATQYKTAKKFPSNMVSIDYHSISPEHSHLPLVIMLVLTQLSVGTFLAEWIFKSYVQQTFNNVLVPFHVLVALGAGLLALGASIFHLGRPLYAYRAILGIMTSWLSREILAFGIFAGLASVYALCFWDQPVEKLLSPFLGGSLDLLGVAVFLSGVLGVFCSVMVYKDTHRPFWDHHFTTGKFFLTMLILGFATVLLISMTVTIANPSLPLSAAMPAFGNISCLVIGIATTIKLILEAVIFFHLGDRDLTFFKKTAILMSLQLKDVTLRRFACGVVGGIFLPFSLLALNQLGGGVLMLGLTVLIFVLLLAGELMERYLFFRAVVPLKMPGGHVS